MCSQLGIQADNHNHASFPPARSTKHAIAAVLDIQNPTLNLNPKLLNPRRTSPSSRSDRFAPS